MSACSSVASRRVAVLCDTCRASAISWGAKAGVPVIHLNASAMLLVLFGGIPARACQSSSSWSRSARWALIAAVAAARQRACTSIG